MMVFFKIWSTFLIIYAIFCIIKADVTVEYLNIATQIEARFATTIIVSKIRNDEGTAKEIAFTAELPEAAFISNFSMFINDKIVVGEVKEKETAKIAYDKAKARGESAGHVAQKPRETNMFKISVNIAANSKAVFNLTYQEMLKRVHGVYKHIVNLVPDQTVDKVQIDVYITENGEISKIKIPKFSPKIGEKTNKEILGMDDEKDADVKKNVNANVSNVQVTFKPGGSSKAGQLVVLYDVERSAKSGGQIEVVNGYFVHFVAPDGFKAGSKHVIFVLDKSGSMQGRKMEQLKVKEFLNFSKICVKMSNEIRAFNAFDDAMKTILGDLDPADKFNIVMFSSDVEKWKTESILATIDNVRDAQEYVRRQSATGSTALNDALVESLQMLLSDNSKSTMTSMLLFMTDGQPTEGETNSDKIVSNVDKTETKKFPIHSLAFGEDADYNILKRVSGKHFGLARKIYEDSDAALQMTGFFDEIRSPVLTEMKIDYLDENIDLDSVVHGDHVHHYYDGGEVVVVGKLKDNVPGDVQLKVSVTAMSASGPVAMETRSAYWMCPDYVYDDVVAPTFWRCCPPYALNHVLRYPCCWPDCCWGYYDSCLPRPPPPVTPKPKPTLPTNTAGGFIERMWAYQTIKKLLKQAELDETGQRSSLRQKALQLSLKYNFVTELTSMVVIDPVQAWRPVFEKVVPIVNRGGDNSAVNGVFHGGSSFGTLGGAGQSSKNTEESLVPPPPLGPDQSTLDKDKDDRGIKPHIVTTTTTTTATSITTNTKATVTGCNINAVFVMDTSGDLEKIVHLIRKTIDSLTTMFSKNIRLTLLSRDSSGGGKAAQLYVAKNVLSESEALKDSLRQTPSEFNLDLLTSLKDALGQRSAGKPVVIFFFDSSQPVQYAIDIVSQLKKTYSDAQVLAVTTDTGGSNGKDLESLTGSSLNVFVTPQGFDIAQSLNC